MPKIYVVTTSQELLTPTIIDEAINFISSNYEEEITIFRFTSEENYNKYMNETKILDMFRDEVKLDVKEIPEDSIYLIPTMSGILFKQLFDLIKSLILPEVNLIIVGQDDIKVMTFSDEENSDSLRSIPENVFGSLRLDCLDFYY